jgi:hypothetical protein
MIELKGVLTKNSFAEQIEKKVLEEDLTYFQAIIEFAEDHDRSPEEMLPYLSQVLLEKVRKSAVDSGLIGEQSTDLESLMS